MAGLSSNSRLIVVPSGHAVHFEQPGLVIEHIGQVVAAARTGQPLEALNLGRQPVGLAEPIGPDAQMEASDGNAKEAHHVSPTGGL
jgi:hypothetical protein